MKSVKSWCRVILGALALLVASFGAYGTDEIKPYKAIVKLSNGTHQIVEFPMKEVAKVEDGIPLEHALLAIKKAGEVIVVDMVRTSKKWISFYEISATFTPTLSILYDGTWVKKVENTTPIVKESEQYVFILLGLSVLSVLSYFCGFPVRLSAASSLIGTSASLFAAAAPSIFDGRFSSAFVTIVIAIVAVAAVFMTSIATRSRIAALAHSLFCGVAAVYVYNFW